MWFFFIIIPHWKFPHKTPIGPNMTFFIIIYVPHWKFPHKTPMGPNMTFFIIIPHWKFPNKTPIGLNMTFFIIMPHWKFPYKTSIGLNVTFFTVAHWQWLRVIVKKLSHVQSWSMYCQKTFHKCNNGGSETQTSSHKNAYISNVCEWNHQLWVLVFLIQSSCTFETKLEHYKWSFLLRLKSRIFHIITILVTFLAL